MVTTPTSSAATHTAPLPAAMAAGPPGTSIRRIRPPFARSIRSTCPSTGEASHTAPPATATPRDPLPADTRPTTRFVRGVDLVDDAVLPVGDPQRATAERHRRRLAADVDRRHLTMAALDARDRPIAAVGDPHRATARGQRARRVPDHVLGNDVPIPGVDDAGRVLGDLVEPARARQLQDGERHRPRDRHASGDEQPA